MMPDSASGVSMTRSFAEVLLQAVGDAEDAAELADVLAHDEDLRVDLHRPAQAGVERLADRQGLGHQCPLPSNDDMYLSNCSRCWSNSGEPCG